MRKGKDTGVTSKWLQYLKQLGFDVKEEIPPFECLYGQIPDISDPISKKIMARTTQTGKFRFYDWPLRCRKCGENVFEGICEDHGFVFFNKVRCVSCKAARFNEIANPDIATFIYCCEWYTQQSEHFEMRAKAAEERIYSQGFSFSPDYSYIYFLTDSKLGLWYIGQTRSLIRRLKEHSLRRVIQRAFYIQLKDQNPRELEKKFIKLFDPPLNKRGKNDHKDKNRLR